MEYFSVSFRGSWLWKEHLWCWLLCRWILEE